MEQCQIECQITWNCDWWSYDKTQGGRCYAKGQGANSDQETDENFYSGQWNCVPSPANIADSTKTGCIKQYTKPKDVNKPKDDKNAKSIRRCQFHCKNDNKCTHWFFDSSDNSCQLLENDNEFKVGDNSSYSFGKKHCNPIDDKEEDVKACERKDTSHWPHNKPSLHSSSDTKKKCQKECKSSCQFWSFYGQEKECYHLENDNDVLIGELPGKEYTFGARDCKPT